MSERTIKQVLDDYKTGKIIPVDDEKANILKKFDSGKLVSLESDDISDALITFYLNMRESERIKAENSINSALDDISLKIALAKANNGQLLKASDRDLCIKSKPSMTDYFVEKHKADGTIAGYLYTKNVDALNVVDLNSVESVALVCIRLAKNINLDTRTVRRIESLVKNIGSASDEYQKGTLLKELSQVLRLSTNGKSLMGIALTASELNKKDEKSVLSDRIKRQGMRRQVYRIKLSAIKVSRVIATGDKNRQNLQSYANSLYCSIEQLKESFN